MSILETLALIALCGSALAVAAFFWGPYLLAAFFEKADEWAEIIESMKDEK